MQEVTIRFKKALFIPPTNRLQFGYIFFYELIYQNGTIENKTVEVFASDVLSAQWHLEFYSTNRDAEKILLQFAKKQIIEKFKEGTLNDREEVVLMSSTHPAYRPYDPHLLNLTENESFQIKPEEKLLFQEIKDNKLAASIIETRDIINTIFSAKHKQKLLLLTQERNLLDFFKPAKNEEEYSHRISSLGQVSRHLNIEILRIITNEPDSQIGSVALLEKFLVSINKPNKSISDTLKNIGYIRKGYPVHVDIADVIKGYKYFNLKYPVTDFENTWTTLLNNYLLSLRQLYEILAETYSS